LAESLGRAAKAASDEAKGKNRIFVWKYKVTVEDDEGSEKVEDRQLDLIVPRKFKRLKFTRLIAANDILGALELIFGAEKVSDLEDLEMDEDEFEMFMERLGEAIGGTSAKN
jgi:hypothetical protein